jgi:hypothetical protein
MTRTAPITIKPAPTSRESFGNNSADKLLTAMLSNLQRAKEPELIARLRESIARIQLARRQNP